MIAPRPLLLVGNKRSGSSLLVKLLNRHPSIYLAHEADIVWLLFQARRGWPPRPIHHPRDGPFGLRRTLRCCGDRLAELLARRAPGDPPPPPELLRRAYFEALESLAARDPAERKMGADFPDERAGKMGADFRGADGGKMGADFRAAGGGKMGADVRWRWVGDKKPVQHADPRLRRFVDRLFPPPAGARFLHLLRHPRDVVGSMIAARERGAVPEDWRRCPAGLAARWLEVEGWVARAAAADPGSTLTVRYEELCRDPAATLERLLAFLDLPLPGELADHARRQVRPAPPRYPEVALPASPGLAALLDRYGYR